VAELSDYYAVPGLEHFPADRLVVTPDSAGALFRTLLLLALQSALVISLLPRGPYQLAGSSEEIPGDVQVLDALRLLRGRFIGHCMVPRFYNGLVETSVAAVGIVTLFSTIVGLHDHGAGLCGYIARLLDFAM
jgi:hypothetical protein